VLGAGHLTSLLLIGLPVVGLGLHFPRGLDAPLELGVAAMIVFLGIGGLTRPSLQTHAHSLRDLGKRPFWVGAAHGLAGSGALTLVILATMPRAPKASSISAHSDSARSWAWLRPARR